MANEKILVVDDDVNICELLRLYLTKEGYQVTIANDGEEGLDKFNQVKPDMVLLDVMMPRMDGLEVCRRIRKLGNTPVMMLTAKGETFDKVLGLELGADDYMVKPFDAKEVVARIKAVLRRCQTSTAAAESTEGVIEFDNLRLDMNSYELRVKGGGGGSPQGAGAAQLPGLPPEPRLHPRPAAGRGMGLRILRRQPHHRRPCQAPAREAGRCLR